MAQTNEQQNSVWFLAFLAEEPEAVLRFRHIVKSLQEDSSVASVEVSNSSFEPHNYGLTVRFRPGRSQPTNKSLQHLDKIYGTAPPSPSVRKTRFEHLLSDDDLFGEKG